MVHQKAAYQWPGDARNSEHGAEISLVAATFGRRHHVAHDCHGEHDQPARPNPLQCTERDQLVHVPAEAGQDRPGEEDDDGELEDAFAAVEIGDLSVQGALTVDVRR